MPDTAEHQHNGDDEPLHRTDRRQRLRGDMADEPHVGEIEDDLHRAVGHERQRKRQHSSLIDMRAAGGIDALRRQSPGVLAV